MTSESLFVIFGFNVIIVFFEICLVYTILISFVVNLERCNFFELNSTQYVS